PRSYTLSLHDALPISLAGLSLLHDQPNYAVSEPTKVMEYMAHGVPVVSTPNAAAKALVERSGSGVVVPFGDVQAAADAVTRLATDRAWREELGASGYGYASRCLAWQRDARAFVTHLEQVAESPRRAWEV